MNDKRDKINIFEYEDYRAFIKDWYQKAKERNPSFSYRAFAKKAGFHSSNFFMLVMQGKRNLTEASLKSMVIGLGLNKQEQEFFRNLVFFNQASTNEDKNFYYQELLRSRKFRQLKPIEGQSYEYYSKWYHPVIRELVISKDFDGTPEWLAGRIAPEITPAQAEKSIELLEDLKFIEKTGPKTWRQTSTIISTGPQVQSIVVHNYHKNLLDLSKDVMDRLGVEDRDTSALTLGVKKEKLPQLRAKIREFRQEILKIVADETEPEEVAQLNIQFFTVTKPKRPTSKGGQAPQGQGGVL